MPNDVNVKEVMTSIFPLSQIRQDKGTIKINTEMVDGSQLTKMAEKVPNGYGILIKRSGTGVVVIVEKV